MKRTIVRLLIVCWLIPSAGCSLLPADPKPPRAAVSAGSTAVEQSGAAEVPARASMSEETRSVPLPSGSDLIFDEKLGTLTVRLSSDTTLTSAFRTESAEAPRSFTPPAPPSPSDLADGRAVLGYRVGLVAGLALGIFGLVRGWDFVMYGGGAIAIACAAGLFVARHPALLTIVGVGGGFAAAGILAWHIHVKRAAPSPAPA